MSTVHSRSLLTTILFLLCCPWAVLSAQEGSLASEPQAEKQIDYATEIQPIFAKYCTACHTEEDANGELLLDSYAGLMAGGEHGPAITPGQPESSRLFLMITGDVEPKMPPDDADGPDEFELELLHQWIEQGGKGSDSDALPMRQLKTPQLPAATVEREPITALALHPNQPLLAIGRFGTVELANIIEGNVDDTDGVQSTVELAGKVNDLRFSEDGSRLVIASGVTGLYGEATVIDVASGELVRKFEGHRDTLYAAALSPDGKLLATCGYDRDVILWDANSGEVVRKLTGHNGAVYDLAFNRDGTVLATASADETVKLWLTATGERLDTLSQPQGEVWCVRFTPDQNRIVAASADNRFRVWRFVSKNEPQINPLIETRFADDSPLLRIAFSADGQRMIVASQAGNLSLFSCQTWNKLAGMDSAGDLVSDVVVAADGKEVVLATIGGELQTRQLPQTDNDANPSGVAAVAEVFFQLDQLTELAEVESPAPNSVDTAMVVPRGAKVKGIIQANEAGQSQADWYRFSARQGEVWMIETRASQDGSPLDSVIEVCDAAGQPIIRHRLQAIRESYFTFRGKDSTQSNDFRLFDWESMELNDWLYSAGEVTRLWMYPRGPDSGFNVYPGIGQRFTYFDTTAVAHALQEPAYVVQPLMPGQPPIENGLPVFELRTMNDDDASRQRGVDSCLRFVAPADGEYTVRVDDTRGRGGADYRYQLTIRPANPDFRATVSAITQPIPAGAGREFQVNVTRLDGFSGPIEFEIVDLPEGLQGTKIVTIEENQQEAYGVVWTAAETAAETNFGNPRVVARANILGRVIEHQAGSLGELKSAGPPSVTLAIVPSGEQGETSDNVLRIQPGETIAAVVRVNRLRNDGEIKLGNEFAGRNTPHGVFVDNIGLNGLMVLKGADQQQFFITAAPIAAPGERLFHLKAELEGGVTSPPVRLIVEQP